VRTLRQDAFALLFALLFPLVFVTGARAEDPLPLVKSKTDPQPATSATSPMPIALPSGSPAATKPRPDGKARGRETSVKPAASVPAVSTLPPSLSAPAHNEIAEAQPSDIETVPDPSPPPRTPAVVAANAKPPSQAHVFILIGALVVLGVMTLRAGRG
jgi:hypothetical protein